MFYLGIAGALGQKVLADLAKVDIDLLAVVDGATGGDEVGVVVGDQAPPVRPAIWATRLVIFLLKIDLADDVPFVHLNILCRRTVEHDVNPDGNAVTVQAGYRHHLNT